MKFVHRFAGAALLLALALPAGCAGTAKTEEKPQTQPEPASYKIAFEDADIATVDGVKITGKIKRPDPTPKNPMPAVVYFHGGGWDRGSAEPNPNSRLAEHGYFTISVEYRLSDVAPFPAQVEDGKATVRWAGSPIKSRTCTNRCCLLPTSPKMIRRS